MTKRRQHIVTEHYPRIATSILRPLVDVLAQARHACDGDMEKFLIMLAVGVRTTEHPEFRGASQAQLMSGEVPVFPSLGTNIRSIADSVGIPKETARRKLDELIKRGWLVREGRDLRITELAYQDLAAVRIGLERLALKYSDVIGALFREVGEARVDEAAGD